MITKLIIDNYALIDNTVIDFKEGFTVITGETGAGKSIMLDALSLLRGARADSKSMGSKDRKTVVEAFFSDPDREIKAICEENNIEWDSKELILRREISPAGKSRAFINDTPVNLSLLSTVSEKLLDIHSQHSNSLLNKADEQLAIIDAFGGTQTLLENYQATFRKYVALRNRIKKIKEAIAQGKENRDFIVFRLEQLDKLKPKKGELAMLEREFEILGDADRLKSDLAQANMYLSRDHASALKQIQNAASLVAGIDFSLFENNDENDLTERLNTLKIELRDISDTLESYEEKIHSDPERFEKIRLRIEAIEEAMNRFKAKDEDELVEIHSQLKEELASITDGNTDVASLEKELKELAKTLKTDAEELSTERERYAAEFAETITERIRPLGLPNVKFTVELNRGKMTSEGQDILTFLCSFNKNHPLQPVSEIASGGEISRVMLGVKSLMGEKMKLPTIIFDEIDTGVSGEIAHKMGQMMKEMAKNIQVMAVTHLPQVAGRGDTHLKVYKADNNEKTVSHIKELAPEERVVEIAGMLSGTTINDIALENAKLLLKKDGEK